MKGLQCVQPKSAKPPKTRKPPKSRKRLGTAPVHPSGRFRDSPGVQNSSNPKSIIPEPQLITIHPPKRSRIDTVMNAVSSAIQTSVARLSAGAAKLHATLHDKFGSALDGCNGARWMAATMALKRHAVQANPYVMFEGKYVNFRTNSEAPLSVYMSYFTRMKGQAEAMLCQTAESSFREMRQERGISLEEFQRSSWWIPKHVPHLNGADAVFEVTAVLGVVSKHSNPAWDQLFRNSSEIQALLESSEDALKSPLCQVGLFALVGLLNTAEEEKILADNYFWTCGTNWKWTSTTASYDSHLEFATTCRDKYGNMIECNVRIDCCLQNHGALVSRTIRILPKPPRLKMQRPVQSQITLCNA